MRRTAGLATTTAMLLVLLAGCGGSDASPSPSVEASASEPAATEPAPTQSQPAASDPVATDPPAAGPVTMKAACASVRARTAPAPSGKLVVVLAKGTKVRVVEMVTGDSYTAGSCGTSGDAWAKIDRVNGKAVKKAYGVDFAYVAAGFLK